MYSSNFQPESSLRWKRVQSVLQSINADAVLLNTNANLYERQSILFFGPGIQRLYLYTFGG